LFSLGGHMFRTIVGLFALGLFFAQAAVAQDGTRFTPRDRDIVLEDIANTIDQYYFDEERAGEIAADLRAADFSEQTTKEAFADAVTAFLYDYDRHFSVRYIGEDMATEILSGPGDSDGGGFNPLDDLRRRNFGFQEVSILPGNVGYIDLRQFAPADVAGDTATAALDFVANTDAVIFDVRQNGGGAPSMVQLLISHFLDPSESIAINTFVSRNNAYPQQLNSLNYLPSVARPDVPVIVLTSGRTGSAAEAFAYHLQAMDRATIIGEVTAGAANPGDPFLTDIGGFSVFISTGSARNPITGTNWETVGVAPDVETNAADALDSALLAAYDQLLESDADEDRKQFWQWGREEVATRLTPVEVDAEALAEVAGTYGPRQVFVEDGVLYYTRDGRPPIVLTPVGEDRFLYGDDSGFRVVFDRNRRGAVTALTIESLSQPPSTSPRDES